MAQKDTFHDLDLAIALAGQTISSNTDTEGASIDTSENESVTFVMSVGPYNDGTYELTIQEADDDGTGNPDTFADADAADILGDDATPSLDAAGFLKVGYRGAKKWVRVVVTSTSTTSGASVSCVAVLGHGRYMPYATQAVT